MRRRVSRLLTIVSPVAFALACRTSSPPPASQATASESSVDAPAKSANTREATGTSAGTGATADTNPAPTGVDEGALDRSVDPCDDFYAYACGGWMKKTPIPEDRPAWTRGFSEINERNEKTLRTILEAMASGGGDPKDAYAQKLGDYYSACMDEAAIEKAGTEPLKEPFAVIDGVTDKATFSKAVGDLYGLGFHPLFAFSSGQDFGDATQVIGQLEQGGLGLPDRDYYLNTDKKSVGIRTLYQEHVGKMLALAGLPPDVAMDVAKDVAKGAAKDAAKVVMQIETDLAKVSMKRVDLRDPAKVYHRMNLEGVKKLAPSFEWGAFVDRLKVDAKAPINVAQPDFVKGVEARLAGVKAGDWKTYLRWSVVHALAPTLPKAFVDEDFRFRSTALTGAEKILPRWKRCVAATDVALGEALAQPFVKATFGAEGKARTVAMVAEIEAAMRHDLEILGWMDDTTRKRATEKLAKIRNKIGFPDRWRNYDALEVSRGSYAKDVLKARAFESKRVLAKIGRPLDRGEWYMTPPTVNAYYDANMNEMVFPAGILQPPFFDRKASIGMNYGAIGMVMGHELTHGFDDQGRQFDGDGNLREWWTKPVSKLFVKKADCVVQQFDEYEATADAPVLHVNGKLTLGENIADLGGIKLAHAALVDARKGKPDEPIGGFTVEQQFFAAFAQGWCQNARPQYKRMLVSIDQHSPPRWRVNGPVSNLPEFAQAFQCKDTSRMVRKNRCEVW